MANRRMFSNRIASSGKFLQMPFESQLLYFHLVMRADDDGIVEAYPITKLLGVAPDSVRVLLVRGFIEQLNEEQVVVIMDWSEHNIIRADRKVDSIYLPLLKSKLPQLPVIEPKPRSDVKDNSSRVVHGQSTVGISKVRLGKVKLSKVKRVYTYPTFEALKSIDDDDINKIIKAYGCTESFVLSCIEDMGNWLGKKGKSGSSGDPWKDYYSALRDWVKRDSIERMDNARKGNPKSGVDLSGL